MIVLFAVAATAAVFWGLCALGMPWWAALILMAVCGGGATTKRGGT